MRRQGRSDVHPPGVVRAHHAHVVRDHVEDLSHAARVQRNAQALEALHATQVRVDRIVVDDVVTVRAVGPRAQVGRAIHVAHAERIQVGHQPCGVGKGEIPVEL
jgi:hypothetical protein